MSQHRALDADRWKTFPRHQQLLMIANEMNRAANLMGEHDAVSRRLAYERVLRLTDLTVQAHPRPALRRELLRWRDVVAALYLTDTAEPVAHTGAFRALLQLHPLTAQQISLLRHAGPVGG